MHIEGLYEQSQKGHTTLKSERVDSQFPSWLSAQEADWGQEALAP